MSTPAEQIQELIEQHRAAIQTRDVESALQITRSMDELVHRSEDLQSKYEHHWWLCKGTNGFVQGRYEEAIVDLRHAMEGALRNNDELTRGLILMSWASCLTHLGRYDQALPKRYESLELIEKHGDAEQLAKSWMNLGVTQLALADFKASEVSIKKSIEFFEVGTNRNLLAHAYVLLASTYHFQGLAVKCLEFSMKAFELAVEINDNYVARVSSCNISVSYFEAGDYVSAGKWNERTLSYYTPDDESPDHINDQLNRMLISFKLSHNPQELIAIHEFMKRYPHYHELDVILQTVSVICDEAATLERFDLLRLFVDHWREIVLNAQGQIARLKFLFADLELAVQENCTVDHVEQCRNIIAESEQRQQVVDTIHGHKLLSTIYEHIRQPEQALRSLRTYMDLSVKHAADRNEKSLAMIGIEHDMREAHLLAKRQRELLESVMPAHVAERLINGAELIADAYEEVSVLFMDIASFTEMSSRIAPGELIHLLEGVFRCADDVMSRHGLTKIKTIGDSYMAVAGIPHAQTDHRQRAAAAALDLISSVGSLTSLHVRVGLSAGPAVAGVIGRQRPQYDVWGDSVNVAARMESTSEVGRVHVSEMFANTFNADDIVLLLRGTLNIKGKGEMKTYWLESA